MAYVQPFEGVKKGRLFRWGVARKRSRLRRTHPRGLSGIMDYIPGADSAINYVKAKVGAFFQLPYEYDKARKQIPSLIEAAKAKNDTATVAQLQAIQAGINALHGSYASAEAKVKAFLDTLKEYGLGVLPLVVAGAAITVAGVVSYQLLTWAKLKAKLDAVKQGYAPSSILSEPLFSVGGLGLGLPVLAVVGVGAYFLLKRN